MPALLETANLSKRFARGGAIRLIGRRPAPPSMVYAVDDVNLTIERGETVGLVGESGCGKSTLVRLLARLIDPSDGDISFAGRSIGGSPARRFARSQDRTRIQMVFQDATDSLNPRLTGFDAM